MDCSLVADTSEMEDKGLPADVAVMLIGVLTGVNLVDLLPILVMSCLAIMFQSG